MNAAADFTALTAPHLPRLHRLGLKLTRTSSDSADLVQEALCRAWANRDRFHEGSSVGAYLSRIVMNTFISRHRHARVVQNAESKYDLTGQLYDEHEVSEADAPERTWHRTLLSDEVLTALDTLAPHYRHAIELVDLQGLPYKQAARELGVPVGTVMSRLHRARRMLRSQLQEYARTRGLSSAAAA
jgi:RNA polymerase sigma-70 factor, ECF subfamily